MEWQVLEKALKDAEAAGVGIELLEMLSCSSQLQCSWMFCWTHRVLAVPLFYNVLYVVSYPNGSWTL